MACGYECVTNGKRLSKNKRKQTIQRKHIVARSSCGPEMALQHPTEGLTPSGSLSLSAKVWFQCGRDLPSQLLHELCVVRRKELHHEAEDGVFRPWEEGNDGI